MKRIPLTQGQFALVDDADFKWLNQWKWYAYWDKSTKGFYAVRNSRKENGKQYQMKMHREILGLKRGNKMQADHINHVTLNNSRSNLRTVTHQQNQWNRNVKGYSWVERSKKYRTQIMAGGKPIALGYFHTTEEAHKAYLEAKAKYHRIKVAS